MASTQRKKITGALKQEVWERAFSRDLGCAKCPICNIRELLSGDFQVGHIKARAEGGSDKIDNLYPICGKCNQCMGTMHMLTFKNKYFLHTPPLKIEMKQFQSLLKNLLPVPDDFETKQDDEVQITKVVPAPRDNNASISQRPIVLPPRVQRPIVLPPRVQIPVVSLPVASEFGVAPMELV